jgi:hypothetical protein
VPEFNEKLKKSTEISDRVASIMVEIPKGLLPTTGLEHYPCTYLLTN